VFSELFRHAKQAGLVTVQLDVSKAFDTIPHEAIGAALRKKGLPEFVVRLVEDSYKRVSTSIRNRGDNIDITIKRGVKQGDPLSPLLFNLIMEPLLQNLQRMPGYKVADETISVLAFADDIFPGGANHIGGRRTAQSRGDILERAGYEDLRRQVRLLSS